MAFYHCRSQFILSNIAANGDVFDFEISPEDMKKLDGLRGASKLANDPDEVNF